MIKTLLKKKCTVSAEADLTDLQLLALRVPRGLVRDELVITQHVQQSGLAGIVQTQEQDASLLVIQAQRGQNVEEPVFARESTK